MAPGSAVSVHPLFNLKYVLTSSYFFYYYDGLGLMKPDKEIYPRYVELAVLVQGS